MVPAGPSMAAAVITAATPSAPPPEPRTYPFTVTLQNGRTQLHITQAMGEKAVKAVADGAPAEDATAEDLQCYQYLLWQESLKLKEQERVLTERRRQASLSSARRAELSVQSSGRSQPSRDRPRLLRMPNGARTAVTRNLEESFMSLDEEGIPIPKTATGALMSVATYLQATQPPEDDPRAALHHQQIKFVSMVGTKLIPEEPPQPAAEVATANNAPTRRQPSPRHEPRTRQLGDRGARGPEDRITCVNNECAAHDQENRATYDRRHRAVRGREGRYHGGRRGRAKRNNTG